MLVLLDLTNYGNSALLYISTDSTTVILKISNMEVPMTRGVQESDQSDILGLLIFNFGQISTQLRWLIKKKKKGKILKLSQLVVIKHKCDKNKSDKS